MSLFDQPVEGRQVAEQRVHVSVVGDIVAEIGHGRGVKRREPERINA